MPVWFFTPRRNFGYYALKLGWGQGFFYVDCLPFVGECFVRFMRHEVTITFTHHVYISPIFDEDKMTN
jgi:hypothetical protein